MALAPCTILLIDDDASHRLMMRRLVAARGMGRVVLQDAATMADGLHLLERESFDLLLLDHTTPEGSSLDELRLVRAQHPRLPVVMHTGYISPEEESTALAEGVREIILKGAFDPLWQAILRACPRLLAPGSGPNDGADGRTVLVVEDDPLVREIVKRTLHDAGFGVVAAEDGAHALELLGTRTQAVHLLFADVRMPGVSGPELGRALAESRPGIPVIYTSGWPEEQVPTTSQLPPSAILLPKPFTPDRLLAQVRTALARAGSRT